MGERKRRSLYLHIGLHKTGSTALQQFLATHADWLLDRGYEVPSVGRAWQNSGHHNLAWQVSGDRRFSPALGTVRELTDRWSSGGDHVILSSEDFVGAVGDDRFAAFVRTAARSFDRVSVVVFLRRQADYACSLFLELLVQGYDRTFTEFLDEATRTGQVRWQEWTFPFDFARLLDTIAAIEGIAPLALSYDYARRDLLTVFLRTCGVPIDGRPFALSQEHRSETPASYVEPFVRNVLRRTLTDRERRLIGYYHVRLEHLGIVLGYEETRRIASTFASSNAAVAKRYRCTVPAALSSRGGTGALHFADVFSRGVVSSIADEAAHMS